jgi:biopolymer transport protein TolR
MPAAMSGRKARRTKNEINMVPFIDVMLVLLIIFMVTAPMLAPSQIELPTVGQAPKQPDRFVHVVIDKDGAIKVVDGNNSTSKETAVPARELVGRVRALMPPDGADAAAQTPIIISADKAVRYEVVIEAMDSLQRAGFGRVGLSVQPVR